jgi:hypothetical protein
MRESLCAPGKTAVVEGIDGIAVRAARKVQGIGEIHTLAEQAQGLANTTYFLRVDVGETEQMLHDLNDPRRGEAVEGSEHPCER